MCRVLARVDTRYWHDWIQGLYPILNLNSFNLATAVISNVVVPLSRLQYSSMDLILNFAKVFLLILLILSLFTVVFSTNPITQDSIQSRSA